MLTSVVLWGAVEEVIAISRGWVGRTDKLWEWTNWFDSTFQNGKDRDLSAELLSRNGFDEISVVLWAYPICSRSFALLFIIREALMFAQLAHPDSLPSAAHRRLCSHAPAFLISGLCMEWRAVSWAKWVLQVHCHWSELQPRHGMFSYHKGWVLKIPWAWG